jgi:hypothetical protein
VKTFFQNWTAGSKPAGTGNGDELVVVSWAKTPFGTNSTRTKIRGRSDRCSCVITTSLKFSYAATNVPMVTGC